MSRGHPPASTIESVLAQVEVLTDGCWRLPHKPFPSGYVPVKLAGVQVRFHILMYQHLVGPIPEGLELDHRCRHRWCGNPNHLEPVTHQVNVLRGDAPTAINARKTHCPQGHPLADENLYLSPQGWRVCRACVRARGRAWRQRQGGKV